MQEHVRHDLFIFGFNDEKKVFYSLSYTINRTFEFCELEYGELEQAFHSTIWDRKLYDWTDRIYMMQYYDREPYELDLSLIKMLMHQYYNSINTSAIYCRYRNPEYNRLFGFQVYDGVKKYYDLLIQGCVWNDFRVGSVLKEHKVCMYERLKHLQSKLQDNRFLEYAKSYEMLAQKSEILLAQQIKYSIVEEKSILRNSVKLVDDMITSEKNVWMDC